MKMEKCVLRDGGVLAALASTLPVNSQAWVSCGSGSPQGGERGKEHSVGPLWGPRVCLPGPLPYDPAYHFFSSPCGRFQWTDGRRWNFGYWASGQPVNGEGNYVALWTRGEGDWGQSKGKQWQGTLSHTVPLSSLNIPLQTHTFPQPEKPHRL